MMLQTVSSLVVVEPRDGKLPYAVDEEVSALDAALPDTVVSAVPVNDETLDRLQKITDEDSVYSLRALIALDPDRYDSLRVTYFERTDWASAPEGSVYSPRDHAEQVVARLRDESPYITPHVVYADDSATLTFHSVSDGTLTFSRLTLAAYISQS